MDKLLSLTEAALKIGVTESRMSQLIGEGDQQQYRDLAKQEPLPISSHQLLDEAATIGIERRELSAHADVATINKYITGLHRAITPRREQRTQEQPAQEPAPTTNMDPVTLHAAVHAN